jgi:hypothetical protein
MELLQYCYLVRRNGNATVLTVTAYVPANPVTANVAVPVNSIAPQITSDY